MNIRNILSTLFFGGIAFFSLFTLADAATLKLSPDTGVYSAGGTFTARVIINTSGQPVNAADGTLSFNPKELSVVSANRNGSIFNLWTQEPTYSNGAGTISFGGGSPTGYTGSAGTVMNITFKALAAGTPKVNFISGSVLAADGQGTNVLTGMNGGTFTINAVTAAPVAETVYIPPANTPPAPVVTSSSHPDATKWYPATSASLAWELPSGVTAVRTLLDDAPSTVPTLVYDEPLQSRTIDDLEEGISYFHIQFKNADGWGRITHYRLAVDSKKPSEFNISEDVSVDAANPERKLKFTVMDDSLVTRYTVQIDGGENVEFIDTDATGLYTLPVLAPGHHTVIAEAFDAAGNSLISTYSFDVASFDKPVFTQSPTRLTTGVIPVFQGTTRKDSTVTVILSKVGSEVESHEVKSDGEGKFIFIPDDSFDPGIYEIQARAKDNYGAQSELSDAVRFVVEEPGYIKVGSFVVSLLSVIVPAIALLLLLGFGFWFVWHKLHVWRRYVIKETKEAETKLASEFATIAKNLETKVKALSASRKGKLTIAETELISQITMDIKNAQERIKKEVSDIDDIVK